jgi:hypothetical protein
MRANLESRGGLEETWGGKREIFQSEGSFFKPNSIGLIVGQKGHTMGCFIGFSPYVPKRTISKILSITDNTLDKIAHIIPRFSIII